MLGDVRDRLGDDVVDGRLDLLGEPLLGQLDELDGERRARQDRLQRRAEAAVGEDRGVDAARQLAQLVERARELGLRLDEQAEDVVGAALERALGEPQLQRERDEALLGAVVEVALQPAALGVAGLDDARARGGQLVVRIGVRERLRDEVGEVAQALLGAGAAAGARRASRRRARPRGPRRA